jgi:hypothetical protein
MYQLLDDPAGMDAGIEAAAKEVTGGVDVEATEVETTGVDAARTGATDRAPLDATALAAFDRAETKSSTGPLPLATQANHFSCSCASESYP